MLTDEQRDIRQSRLDYISTVMAVSKVQGNPAKFVVLREYNRIVDNDRDYTLIFPDFPPHPCVPAGTHCWVNESSDDVKLIEVVVIEDQVEGLMVKPLDRNVEFLVHRDEVKSTPVPFRPLAIRRKDLKEYIGDELAARIIASRQARHGVTDG